MVGFVGDNGHSRLRAAVWKSGKLHTLPTLGRGYQAVDVGDSGEAVALNDRGQVIDNEGWSGEEALHAFVWENGKMIDLGTLPAGRWASAVALNERGQIVGRSTTKSGD